jgi:hypothetical protein
MEETRITRSARCSTCSDALAAGGSSRPPWSVEDVAEQLEELNSYNEIQHYVHKFGSIQVTSKMKYNGHT